MVAFTPNNTLSPEITFRVNTETLRRFDWLQPSRNTLDGNETVTEADNLKNTRSTWLANLAPGCNFIAEHDGFTFTAYGKQAAYLKKLYVKGRPDDVLQIVANPAPPIVL